MMVFMPRAYLECANGGADGRRAVGVQKVKDLLARGGKLGGGLCARKGRRGRGGRGRGRKRNENEKKKVPRG